MSEVLDSAAAMVGGGAGSASSREWAGAGDGAAWPPLAETERGALRELLIHGPLPRAEIARRLGMSRASLTRVTRALMEHGLIAEGEVELRGATGRPSELLVVRRDARHFFGVKLTGDTAFAVVTDLGARIVARHEEPIVSTEVDAVIDQIVAAHARFAADYPAITAGGVTLAGDLTEVGGRQIVKDSPFLGWHDVFLADLVTERLGIPMSAENDVRALTATEHWFGAGVGCRSLALITIGAGIGFGFVIDDRLVTGHHGRAGSLDHLPIDPAGPICGRGHRGCASAVLPSPAIVDALRMPGLDYPGVVALARDGHAPALRAFADAGHALGVLIGTVANALDPQKIVLTGDGLPLMELAGDVVHSVIDQVRAPGVPPIELDVQPFEFDEWARAGAVLGIRTALQF
ncbi:putative NBD/HSP70 family sugar kinase [Diaminobutyricimonas aerilata]|uniref:Putative NBD/HSP70 family sugar kinase n=1 Tax=Diaminobutyricimonas aerilata TaxID=1162967 RepID=A0A2M9CM53_9MICO|nr:ROK family transcriptional regulator [Diaminobutyricimonas aerilata]PJJ72938.1 putative NBD/HSP70 family sugar kinase [Diaminobutyricimonas aerilata]